MFDNIAKILKKFSKNKEADSKDTAKERLHLVLMQDRANVSADFLDLMKQEIIDVIKKYIDVDETSIDVKLTNKMNGDGTTGAPILYANIPIVSIKDENKNKVISENKKEASSKEEQNENLEERQEKEENTKNVEENSDQTVEQEKEQINEQEENKQEENENTDNQVKNEENKKQYVNNYKQNNQNARRNKKHKKKKNRG